MEGQGQGTCECRYRHLGCRSTMKNKASEANHASKSCKFNPAALACAEVKPRVPSTRSNYRGVVWSVADGKWQASCHRDGKPHFVGLFSDVADAAKAIDAYAREVQFKHWHNWLSFPTAAETAEIEAEDSEDVSVSEEEDEEAAAGSAVDQGQSAAAAAADVPEDMVERILEARGQGKLRKYRVKWQGYPEAAATWEPIEHCEGCDQLIAAFEKTVSDRLNLTASALAGPCVLCGAAANMCNARWVLGCGHACCKSCVEEWWSKEAKAGKPSKSGKPACVYDGMKWVAKSNQKWVAKSNQKPGGWEAVLKLPEVRLSPRDTPPP